MLETEAPAETTMPLVADDTGAETAALDALGDATPESSVDELALEATDVHSVITGALCGGETTKLEISKAVRTGLATEVASASDAETPG